MTYCLHLASARLQKSLLTVAILPVLILAAGILPARSSTTLVKMVNFGFEPQFVTIKAGDTVVWTNTTFSQHNVVSSNSAWVQSPLFTSPGTFSVTFANAGTYGYYCSPHRSFGMTGAITVQSGNQAPSVALTSPVSGATLVAGAPLTLKASASDPDGTVTNVQFFSGTTLLGNAVSSPYSLTVSSLAAGPHTLTARAVDNQGLSTTSAPVNVSAVNSVPAVLNSEFIVAQGGVQLGLTVTPGLSYALEYTTNLANWLVFTNFVATNSVMKFASPTSTDQRRLFRTRLLPNP